MLDRVFLVESISCITPELPRSIPFGESEIRIHSRFDGSITIDFNIPKISLGHNAELLTIGQDIDTLFRVTQAVESLNPGLRDCRIGWKVLSFELAENREVPDPQGFSNRVGYASLGMNKANVTNHSGYLSTLVGPKCCRTRIYPKEPECGKIFGVNIEDTVRHELAVQKSKIIREMPCRSIGAVAEFLNSGKAQSWLDHSWEKFAAPFADCSWNKMIQAIRLLNPDRLKARDLIAYGHYRSERGLTQTIRDLQLSRSQCWAYGKAIREATAMVKLQGSEIAHQKNLNNDLN